MSDEDYEYDYGSDVEDNYGSGDDEQQDDQIEIENAYYEGDDCKQDDPVRAVELFSKVIKLETEKDDQIKWTFRSLEVSLKSNEIKLFHLVKLHHQLNEPKKMLERYQELLGYVSQVTRNECTSSINNILDAVSTGMELDVITQIYKFTLAALKSGGNERLWFNTKAKLAKTYIEHGAYIEADTTILELHETCQNSDGSDDKSKGTLLLEVYGLIIQLCKSTKNATRMKEVYANITNLEAVVEDPRTMGLIREEGGKMYMSAGQWNNAYNEFYEAFRNYQEAGNRRAKDCLKYVVLANMLALSDINPFAARETKVYQEDKEVAAMMDLRLSYESNDLSRFENTLQSIRVQVMISTVKPFKRLKLSYIASELNLSHQEVETILVRVISDGKISAKIDQFNGVLELNDAEDDPMGKSYDVLLQWIHELNRASELLTAQIN